MIRQERSFEEWVNQLPSELKRIIYFHGPIPNLMQVNYVFLSNILNKQSYLNPSTEELIYWIEVGKIFEEKKKSKLQKKNKSIITSLNKFSSQENNHLTRTPLFITS